VSNIQTSGVELHTDIYCSRILTSQITVVILVKFRHFYFHGDIRLGVEQNRYNLSLAKNRSYALNFQFQLQASNFFLPPRSMTVHDTRNYSYVRLRTDSTPNLREEDIAGDLGLRFSVKVEAHFRSFSVKVRFDGNVLCGHPSSSIGYRRRLNPCS
jgi:hypothetical protein